MLHLDGMLGVGLGVVELAHIHSGLLRLVRGGGLEGEGKQMILIEVKEILPEKKFS